MPAVQSLLFPPAQPDALLAQIRQSPSAARLRAALRAAVPALAPIPQTTYTLYREFENTGQRDGYQAPYYLKRAMLTRAVVEFIFGDDTMRDAVHDLLWSICEETTWVLPAHEEQGPDFWELHPTPRTWPWGSNSLLTRAPDSIDLFAAETGASLAETIFLIGDRLAPEVVQRVRQEVVRHLLDPYLAYGRRHWWYRGALNWNGVCNGAIGLAFLRLEKDPQRLSDAIEMVLEGFDAYIATGFEPDGGSIEGPSYWNYGLMYYVTVAELLRERTGGRLDLLAAPRMKAIARYPLAMALAPGIYNNFGDATEQNALQPGIVQKLAERTGVTDLRCLLIEPDDLAGRGALASKLAITLRDFAWWDGDLRSFPDSAYQDAYLPDCAIVKLGAQRPGKERVLLVAKAGHNDGHHSHTDVGHFVVNVAGESLLCDPGRGLYSREYFRRQRYDNLFNNSFGHSVPCIGGQLQSPGPEFGGRRRFYGTIVEQGQSGEAKKVVIDFHTAYDLPALVLARRTLTLDAAGVVCLHDRFEFQDDPLEIEEAFVTWKRVEVLGSTAILHGERTGLRLHIAEPAGAVFTSLSLAEECRRNRRAGMLTRLAVALPRGAATFTMQISDNVR
ncbi:MAG: heparinase II/III domain-containing protein [Chloroflexota bacterium]